MTCSLRAVLLGALSILLFGCDDGPVDDRQPDLPVPGCADDCPAGLECRERVCVGPETPPWPIALRLLPRADDPLAPAEVRPFVAEGPLTRLPSLPLSERASLRGRAVVAGPDGGTAIRVRVTARALFGIDEQPITAQGEIVDDADGPEFVLQVAPFWPTDAGARRGAVYALNLRPEDAAVYPPWAVDDVRVDPGGGAIRVELPAAERLPTVEGVVLLTEDDGIPVAGMRVFVVDGEGRRISTETFTDASGAFALRFWPSDTPRNATLRVRRAGEVGPLPEVDRPITVPASADDEADFNQVILGPLPSIATLEGQIDDGEAPVGGVVIRLRGEVGQGTFSVDAGPTDVDGRFTVSLYPGRYRVDLDPPADTNLRLVRLESDLDPSAPPRWTLEAVTQARGRLVDPAGVPVIGARIEARLRTALYADPELEVPGETPPARIRQVETDGAGQFALPVDPGIHTLRVVPPVDTGLPISEHELIVPAGAELAPVELEIPPAAAVVFELRDPSGRGASDVVVEAWRTDIEPPVRVGSTTTDADGAGVIRLPAVP